MPNSVIARLHEESGIEESKLEAIWKTAANHAKKNNIANPEAYANGAVQHAAKNKALDSSRFIDDNGYLIAPNSVITGADVAKYYGAEIPRFKDLGLNPQQIYHVYRPIEEIKDNDFSGKFLLDKHIGDFEASTHDTHRDHIIGTVYDCELDNDKIIGTVSFADPKAQDDLDNGKKYLSAGYWYTPILGAGTYEGQHYDIKMTDIRANHVAHVDNPRYKGAVIGDEDIVNKKGVIMFKNKLLNNLMNRIRGLGLDEESVKKMEEEAKAEDEAAEEMKKKAEDATCGKDEDDKKAEDEHEDEKEDKKLIKKELMKEKGMDANTINAAIQKGIKEGLAKMKAEQMAMDSALQSYEKLFGKANRMAMDSADAVYDAILNAKGLNAAGKTREQKAAMVEVVTASVQPKRVIAQDAANVDEFVNNNSMIKKYIS